MKKYAYGLAGVLLLSAAQATTIVQLTESAPGAPAVSSETIAAYDCFIVKNGSLRQAMGSTPEASQSGVEAVAAYLDADFAANYPALLQGAYGMLRDLNWKDFRNSSGSVFGDRFGLVVYNPVDGTKEGVGDIAWFRVFNLDNKTTINDTLPDSGYWSGWRSGGSAVPEPSGGILVLVGVAGLALRRKKEGLCHG